jgi:hypothetical protein
MGLLMIPKMWRSMGLVGGLAEVIKAEEYIDVTSSRQSR